MMTVTVLTDNHPGKQTAAEHGFSCLVEHDRKRILFDSGQSDLFLNNASILGIDPGMIDTMVLSHGHYDHGNGFRYLDGGGLICHPGCFVKRYRKSDHSSIGLALTREEMAEKFDLILTREPFYLSDRILFLGEIPRITDFESKQSTFVLETGEDDFVEDDSALALIGDRGVFVITGCGHAGIVNTLEHARRVTGSEKITGIMGGFHLKQADEQARQTVRYLKEQGVARVLPSHCTGDPALSLFEEAFGIRRVRSGDRFLFS